MSAKPVNQPADSDPTIEIAREIAGELKSDFPSLGSDLEVAIADEATSRPGGHYSIEFGTSIVVAKLLYDAVKLAWDIWHEWHKAQPKTGAADAPNLKLTISKEMVTTIEARGVDHETANRLFQAVADRVVRET